MLLLACNSFQRRYKIGTLASFGVMHYLLTFSSMKLDIEGDIGRRAALADKPRRLSNSSVRNEVRVYDIVQVVR